VLFAEAVFCFSDFGLGLLSLWWCLVRIWDKTPTRWLDFGVFLWGDNTVCFCSWLFGVMVVIGNCWSGCDGFEMGVVEAAAMDL
jgi:hypothetical protein